MTRTDVESVACCVSKIALSQMTHNDDKFANVVVLVCDDHFTASHYYVVICQFYFDSEVFL